MPMRVLLVARDPAFVARMQGLLQATNAACRSSADLDELGQDVGHTGVDAVVLERRLLEGPEADAIAKVRDLPGAPDVVVLSDGEDPADDTRLLTLGCTAVLPAGVDDAVLQAALRSVFERRSLRHKQRQQGPGRSLPGLEDFESASSVMQALMKLVRRVSQSDSTLLVLGETGVGKEWLARGIHAAGSRSHGPFIAVNCGAFPETLLETELFGHEKGAFTSAVRTRKGWFEVAHGGTLFLDEIAEMPAHLQVRLLRVLQEREVVRVGGERAIPVNVRVIAATNRDIEADVQSGRFRQDLYYRLNVVSLRIPPLRERAGDVPELAARLLDGLRATLPGTAESLSTEAVQCLCAYAWPGNVRELVNVLERALLLAEGREITPEELPESVRFAAGSERPVATGAGLERMGELARSLCHEPLPEARRAALAAFEHAYLSQLLTETGGRIGETARRAGIRPRSLFERLRHYGLRKEDFRDPGRGSSP